MGAVWSGSSLGSVAVVECGGLWRAVDATAPHSRLGALSRDAGWRRQGDRGRTGFRSGAGGRLARAWACREP